MEEKKKDTKPQAGKKNQEKDSPTEKFIEGVAGELNNFADSLGIKPDTKPQDVRKVIEDVAMDEFKAEVAYEYQAEIDLLTRQLHQVLAELDAADITLPEWANGMVFGKPKKAKAEMVAFEPEPDKEEWEIKTLPQTIGGLLGYDKVDAELAKLLNEGWEIIDFATTAVSNEGAGMKVSRFVTLKRKKAASKAQIIDAAISMALTPSPSPKGRGEPVTEMTFAEGMSQGLPVSRLQEIGNREALEKGRETYEGRLANVRRVNPPPRTVIMQPEG